MTIKEAKYKFPAYNVGSFNGYIIIYSSESDLQAKRNMILKGEIQGFYKETKNENTENKSIISAFEEKNKKSKDNEKDMQFLDECAMRAMQGIIGYNMPDDSIAKKAYEIANAMLKEREKQQNQINE